jgi:hypothetical protein
MIQIAQNAYLRRKILIGFALVAVLAVALVPIVAVPQHSSLITIRILAYVLPVVVLICAWLVFHVVGQEDADLVCEAFNTAVVRHNAQRSWDLLNFGSLEQCEAALGKLVAEECLSVVDATLFKQLAAKPDRLTVVHGKVVSVAADKRIQKWKMEMKSEKERFLSENPPE